MTKNYTVKSTTEAWNKANEIFPTDYECDNQRSERAGYPVYSSTAEGHWYDYICDLGDRLELNLSNGDTVNIWVKADEDEDNAEPTEAEIQQMVADTHAAQEAGKTGFSHIEPQSATIYHFCVMHTDYDSNAAEHAMAEAIDRSDEFMRVRLASDYASAWCDANGILWGSIEIFHKPYKYSHHNAGNYHYVFTAIVTPRISK